MSIAILIPVFNGIEFLEEAIQSVINQTYTDWVVHIGINGHGESGGDVAIRAREIATVDTKARIHVHIQPPPICNKSKSLNDLVRRTTSEWICVLDVDDKWAPEKLERQYEITKTMSADVIGTGCVYFGESTNIPNIPYGLLLRGSTLQFNPIINSSVMIKSKHAYWNETHAIQGIEDYDMWLRLDYQGVKMYNIDTILTYHRIHKQSFFNTKPQNTEALISTYRKRNWSSNVTVVTALYPLVKAKFDISKYIEWLGNFCKMPCNLVVYTNSDLYPIIQSVRGDLPVHFVIKEFNSYKMTSPSMMEFWNKQLEKDPERHIHSPELYAVWALKQECVQSTLESNPFNSKWFVWCDIGIQRHSSKQELYMNLGNYDIEKLCQPNRIGILEIVTIPDSYIQDWKSHRIPVCYPLPEVTLGGGCIVGDYNAWDDFCTAYIEMLKSFDERGWFAGKDQHVYLAMLMERATKLPFRIFHTSSNNGLDPWMSFPVILGGVVPASIDMRFEA